MRYRTALLLAIAPCLLAEEGARPIPFSVPNKGGLAREATTVAQPLAAWPSLAVRAPSRYHPAPALA